jgi:hypothetical protein
LWDAQGVQSAVGTAAVDDTIEMILDKSGRKKFENSRNPRKIDGN